MTTDVDINIDEKIKLDIKELYKVNNQWYNNY